MDGPYNVSATHSTQPAGVTGTGRDTSSVVPVKRSGMKCTGKMPSSRSSHRTGSGSSLKGKKRLSESARGSPSMPVALAVPSTPSSTATGNSGTISTDQLGVPVPVDI